MSLINKFKKQISNSINKVDEHKLTNSGVILNKYISEWASSEIKYGTLGNIKNHEQLLHSVGIFKIYFNGRLVYVGKSTNCNDGDLFNSIKKFCKLRIPMVDTLKEYRNDTFVTAIVLDRNKDRQAEVNVLYNNIVSDVGNFSCKIVRRYWGNNRY